MKQYTSPKLGRWNTELNYAQQLRNIDLANCDSCASCGKEEKTHFSTLEIEEEFIELMSLQTEIEIKNK